MHSKALLIIVSEVMNIVMNIYYYIYIRKNNIYNNRVSRKKVGLPNSNGGTIEIAKNKKGGPNKWYHKNLQKAIL